MQIDNLSYRPFKKGQEEAVVTDLFDNNGVWIGSVAFRTEYLLYGKSSCHGKPRRAGSLSTEQRLRLLECIRESRDRLYRIGLPRTYASWRESGLSDLEDFCRPWDIVDEKMTDFFSQKDGIVKHDYVQDGEIFGFGLNENGCHVPLYHTFCKMGGVWFYAGVCQKGDDLCMKTPASRLDICIAVLEKKLLQNMGLL